MCEKEGQKRQKAGGGPGRPTVFLDRDGTINEEVHYLHRPEDLRLLPGAAAAIRLWNENGFRVVVVTNQAGVARGYYTEADVENLHRYLNAVLAGEGAKIDAFYYCPHHPVHGIGQYRIRCRCRKPGTGMFEAAQRDCPVDRARSYMIGDKWLDTRAGAAFGLHTVLVGTGYGAALYQEMQEAKSGLPDAHPMDYYAKDLLAAARWILQREGGGNESDGSSCASDQPVSGPGAGEGSGFSGVLPFGNVL